ncbi:MAG TPA: ROK family transcriptional regulator [Aestuariivirga sp.]|nr:ROK family transcriptional regulator [Aestuariivirga sp.]
MTVMRAKADSELVRRQNRGIVLETLRQQGPLARIELGRMTGLSPATITSISGQLIDQGLVRALAGDDQPEEPLRRGRPLTRLDLNPHATNVLAVKVSIDGVELALADFRGEVRRRAAIRLPIYEADRLTFGHAVASEIKAFLARFRVARASLARIGVAVQGLADTQSGAIVWSPAFSARNIPLGGPIEKVLGIPCSVANDANMIAEGLIGTDRRRYGGTTAVVFMGYGVGMGLIVNGAVYHGSTGAAAEFGHMNHIPHGPLCRCGRQGCIEAYAADYGIHRAAAGLPDSTSPSHSAVPQETMLDLEASAQGGDRRAIAAFQRAGEALGYGIARLIAILDPGRIVLAGPGTRAMPLIEPALRRAIDEGVVDALRRNVEIDVVPIATDMIVKGTIDSALRHLDREVFAAGHHDGRMQPAEKIA